MTHKALRGVVGNAMVMELWQKLRRLARRQMRRAGWRASQREREETRAIVKAARERPDDDVQRRFERTFGATKKQQLTAWPWSTCTRATTRHGSRCTHRRSVTRSCRRSLIGTSAVRKLDFGSVVAAATAWLGILRDLHRGAGRTQGRRWGAVRPAAGVDVRLVCARALRHAEGQGGAGAERLRG